MKHEFFKKCIASFLLILSMGGNINCITYATTPEETSIEQAKQQSEQGYEEWIKEFEKFKQETDMIIQFVMRVMRKQMDREQRSYRYDVLHQGQKLLTKEPSDKRRYQFEVYARLCYALDTFYHGLNILENKLNLIKTRVQIMDRYYEVGTLSEFQVLYKKDIDEYLNTCLKDTLNEKFFNSLVKINDIVIIIKNVAVSHKGDILAEKIERLMEDLNTNICMCYGRSYRIIKDSAGADLYSCIDKLLNDMDSACKNTKDFQKILPQIA